VAAHQESEEAEATEKRLAYVLIVSLHPNLSQPVTSAQDNSEPQIILAEEGTIEPKHFPVFLQGRPAVAPASAAAPARETPAVDEDAVKFSIGATKSLRRNTFPTSRD
jgi:hypothetical protein